MSWTYRVVKDDACGEDGFSIREVYNIDDEQMWSENPKAAYGEYAEELKQDLIRMLQAFDKPIMEETTETISGFPELKEILH